MTGCRSLLYNVACRVNLDKPAPFALGGVTGSKGTGAGDIVMRYISLLLAMQPPIVLLFIGGVIGMLTLYAVSKGFALYRLLYTQRDRDAALLREVIAAADRLQVSDRG